jgi:hypothetical protein
VASSQCGPGPVRSISVWAKETGVKQQPPLKLHRSLNPVRTLSTEMNPRPKSRPVTQRAHQLRPNAARGKKLGQRSDPVRPGCRRTPLPDLNYLNLGEIKAFCRTHGIPYSIWIETSDGGRQKTREDDRKGVILERIRQFLQTRRVPAATCFPARVVCFEPAAKKLKATDRLYYPQYDPRRTALVELLSNLTGGKFRHGALARILARDFWSRGIAPTYQEFATAWLEAQANHTRPNPEWAFLSDRSAGKETANWRQLRARKAKQALRELEHLTRDWHRSGGQAET